MKIATRLVFALCCLAGLPLANAQVALSPPMADISLDGPVQTQSFRLMNDSHAPMHVAVTVSNWGQDANGNVITVPTTEQSLAPWVQINPTEFTVAPGQSQVVRYAIRPALVLTPGEHRAMVFFTEKHLPGDNAPSGKLRVNFNLGASIYGHVGPVHENGQIDSIKTSAQALMFAVHNTGNATTRMRGQYAIWKSDAYPKKDDIAISADQLQDSYKSPNGLVRHGKLPTSAVLPDSNRTVTLDLSKQPLPPGSYVLRTRATLGDTDISRELRFNVSTDRH